MKDLWRVVLIRSSNPAHKSFGTGFPVHCDGQVTWIVTCAHVVDEIMGEIMDGRGESDMITAADAKATLVASGFKDGSGIDIAIVCVEKPSNQLPLRRASDEKGKSFRTVGFQRSDKDFTIRQLNGILGGLIGTGRGAQAHFVDAWDLEIKDTKYHLQNGYSGSPVIDESNYAVAVVNTKEGEGNIGTAISVEAIEKVWSGMPPNLFEQSRVDTIEKSPVPPRPMSPVLPITYPLGSTTPSSVRPPPTFAPELGKRQKTPLNNQSTNKKSGPRLGEVSGLPIGSTSSSGNAAPPASPSGLGQQAPVAPPTYTLKTSRRNCLMAAAGVAALGGAGVCAYFIWFSKSPTPTPSGTVTVQFTFSTEKLPWLQAALSAFQEKKLRTKSGKAIQVTLNPLGSEDAHDQLLHGALMPTAWSPASSLEVEQLKADWESQNGSTSIIEASADLLPKSLVVSPLVFAAWTERAEPLKRKFGRIDFQTIHDAVTLEHGWADIDAQHANWGKVKFGHTRPDRSNSGLLTTILIAYAFYHNQSQVLTIDQIGSPGFKPYFYQIENGVKMFGNSSGTFFPCFLNNGPSTYDLITTYENLVFPSLTSTPNTQATWELFYPSLNILSDHPFAILTDTSQEEREAAIEFRTFLLHEDQQRLALQYGFRPNSTSQILLTDPISGNLFNKSSAAIQIKPKIGLIPDIQTINALIQLWKAGGYDKYIAAPGC